MEPTGGQPKEDRQGIGGRGAILDAARRLEAHGTYLFFKHAAHFQNPLVPSEWATLADEPALDDPAVRHVVLELLPSRLPALASGIYSPVPIARGLEAGREVGALLDEFRYELIHVDDEQRWTWMGRPVAPRIKAFFLEHLAWEPALERWFFEYRVNPDWWDKSYLEAAITPICVTGIVEESVSGAGSVEEGGAGEGSAGVRATLSTGATDRLDLRTLRLDRRERLFCRTERHGEALFTDAVRFSILRHVNEACDAVRIAGRWHPLQWPPPSP